MTAGARGSTIGELAASAVLIAAFAVNEARRPHPLVPLSIFRIKGLAAADATQVIALAGFYSMFFFVTLYMQNVLGFSAFRLGLATFRSADGRRSGRGYRATKMFIRTGTRPLIVSGALIAAGGVFWLSRIPAHGFYWTDLFPGLVIMGFGLGGVFVGVQTAANAGVPPSLAGLAAALITASFQVGAALGLAIFSAIATARTSPLLAAHAPGPWRSPPGSTGRCCGSIFSSCAAVIALRAANTRGEPSSTEITGVAVAAAPEDAPDRVRTPRPSPEQA